MYSTLRAAARCSVSEERRPARQLGRQQPHELALWFQPAQEARASVCGGCGEQVPFVIWMADLPGWRCTVCADGDRGVNATVVERRRPGRTDGGTPAARSVPVETQKAGAGDGVEETAPQSFPGGRTSSSTRCQRPAS
jgi:hypothetical protein